jgi:hypothetical protein
MTLVLGFNHLLTILQSPGIPTRTLPSSEINISPDIYQEYISICRSQDRTVRKPDPYEENHGSGSVFRIRNKSMNILLFHSPYDRYVGRVILIDNRTIVGSH